MLDLPWRGRLDGAKTVLIAGAGGGFDLFSGLPLYFALRAAGKQVHLASLSFTYLGGTDADEFGFGVRRVTGETGGEEKYFPEKHLAEWLAMDGDDVHYAFRVNHTGGWSNMAGRAGMPNADGLDSLRDTNAVERAHRNLRAEKCESTGDSK